MGESPEEQIELESAIKTLNEEIHSLENDPKKAEDDEKVIYLNHILGEFIILCITRYPN
jgi:hypothetical protein